MAALNRVRTALQKAAVLQRLSSTIVHRTPQISSGLQHNKAFHSSNFVKRIEVYLPSITVTRHYADLPQMTLAQLEARALHVLQLYDKIDPEKLTIESDFIKDLGLDSLDVVEIVMALEDEFGVEINDEEAEKIANVKDAVELLGDKFDVTE